MLISTQHPVNVQDSHLHLMLNSIPECPITGNCLNDRIICTLLGSKKTRLSGLPTTEQRQHLVQIVNDYTRNDAPIEAVIMWGALKGYGIFNDRLQADLFDAMALRRLNCLQHHVAQQYAHGIHFSIIFEDITEYVLADNSTDIDRKMAAYFDSLYNMIQSLGFGQFVSVHRESDLLEKRGGNFNDFCAKARRNGEVIFNYWQAAHQRGYVDCDDLPENESLRGIGWVGKISQEQWAFYIERAGTEHPEWCVTQRAESVCLYLGNALARKQFGTFAAITHRSPLKVSFVAYPPGVDEKMYLGRIEYKVKDTKNDHGLPPWAGYGMLVNIGEGNFEFTALSVRDMRRPQTCFKVEVSDKGSCFRADVVLK